jgi:hypothetical protein
MEWNESNPFEEKKERASELLKREQHEEEMEWEKREQQWRRKLRGRAAFEGRGAFTSGRPDDVDGDGVQYVLSGWI